jgi:hypothetical protein
MNIFCQFRELSFCSAGSFEHYVFMIVSRVCIASIFSELRSKDNNGQIENVPHTPNIQRSFERLCRQS